MVERWMMISTLKRRQGFWYFLSCTWRNLLSQTTVDRDAKLKFILTHASIYGCFFYMLASLLKCTTLVQEPATWQETTQTCVLQIKKHCIPFLLSPTRMVWTFLHRGGFFLILEAFSLEGNKRIYNNYDGCVIPLHECLFSLIDFRLPFYEFEVGVLNHLEIAPSKLHLVNWGYIKSSSISVSTKETCSY